MIASWFPLKQSNPKFSKRALCNAESLGVLLIAVILLLGTDDDSFKILVFVVLVFGVGIVNNFLLNRKVVNNQDLGGVDPQGNEPKENLETVLTSVRISSFFIKTDRQ